jgi:hypothetical protein
LAVVSWRAQEAEDEETAETKPEPRLGEIAAGKQVAAATNRTRAERSETA